MNRLLAAAVLAAASLSAHAAEPVAFVADLRGNAMIEGDGKVSFLAELPSDTRLLLGTGATVTVTFVSTGSEYTFRGPGEFMVGASEVIGEKGAPPTRRTVSALPTAGVIARVSQTASASLRMRSVQPDAKARLEYPVDTRVSTLQPVLRWWGDAAADGFTVTLSDANGREVWKGLSQPGSASLPVKLAPGMRYTWSVVGATKIGEAQFETLPADAIARMAHLRAAAQRFSERVLNAMLLQELGASQEAREAWETLARERPDLPGLAALAK